MIDQRPDSRRQAASSREDQMYDALEPVPGGQDADETPVGQRVPADMIRQDRDTQPVDGGMANGHHIGTAHPGHHAQGTAAAVFVLQLSFEIFGIIAGGKDWQSGQLLHIRDLARKRRSGDKYARRPSERSHGQSGIARQRRTDP